MIRRATPNEIAWKLPHLGEEEVIAMSRAGICFIDDEDGTFTIDNLDKVRSIIVEKILREL